jgi:aldehyde dehydrogenase (NAD+)
LGDLAGGREVDVLSPHSEEPIAKVTLASVADIDAAVAAARASFDSGVWAETDPAERIRLVSVFADLYQERIPEISETISKEMGSTITFSNLAQGPASWAIIATMVQLAQGIQWEESRPSAMAGDIVVRREPVGVVAAIVPWNFPQGLAMPKLVGALLTGCSVVLKPAPESALDALILAEVVEKVGFPEGVVSIVPADRAEGAHLVAHSDVDKVAFTGSTAAGRIIGATCGEQIKRVSLELGGKSAAVILDDADPAAVAAGLKIAGLMNNGQICAAQTRILVPKSRASEYIDAIADMMRKLVVGDPNDPATEIGPLVSKRQQERVTEYIDVGISEGAKVAVGGPGLPEHLDRGWYVKPTLFVDAVNSMRIAREEIFGPVLTVIGYDDLDEAIAIANDSPYGLAGSVWTMDDDTAMTVARRLRTGSVGINGYGADLNGPFGGYKASGIGREHGREGLESYLELKQITPPSAGVTLG